MPFYLLCISLFLIPLIGPLTIEPLVNIKDIWTVKEFLVLLSITIICVIPSPSKHHTLPWPIQWLMGFLIISTFLIPPIHFKLGNSDLGGLWCYKSIVWVFAYFMLYQRIQAMRIDQRLISMAICYTALISSVYAIFQFFNLDQFQFYDRPIWEAHRQAGDITAMIGSPVYLAVFLCICLPFCFLTLPWWQVIVVVVAIWICQSDTANVFGIVTSMVYFAMRAKPVLWLKILAAICLVLLIVVPMNWSKISPHLGDNGRFLVWQETFKDWHSPPITLGITPDMSKDRQQEVNLLNHRIWAITGRGVGSFEYIFQLKKQGWNHPHNEYLKVLYELGIVGFMLFMTIIIWVLWKSFLMARKDPWVCCLFSSFIFICLSATTMPMLLVEPIRIFSVVIICFLLYRINSI